MKLNWDSSKSGELSAVIVKELAQTLPSLFRTHRELMNRAGSADKVQVSAGELAASLGCEVGEFEAILKGLATFGFVEYKLNWKEDGPWTKEYVPDWKQHTRWTIKILVR